MKHTIPENELRQESLIKGVKALCAADPDLENVVNEFGNPPLWYREPGYATLVHIILEQQVSLASAKAAYNKLKEASDHNLIPVRFLEFSDIELKNIGFSRQKN